LVENSPSDTIDAAGSLRFLILSPRFPKVRLSELVVHADFLEVISAIGIEDLFTKKIQPQSHAIEVLGHLIKVAAAKNPALLIEYPKSAERRAASGEQETGSRECPRMAGDGSSAQDDRRIRKVSCEKIAK